MNTKTTPYEVAEMKKMNTVVLTRTFIRIMGYSPSAFVGRGMMVQMIWAKQHPVEVTVAENSRKSWFEIERQRQIAEQDRSFSDSKIRTIRARWNKGNGDSINSLAKEYGCTFNTMSKIVRRESYKDVE